MNEIPKTSDLKFGTQVIWLSEHGPNAATVTDTYGERVKILLSMSTRELWVQRKNLIIGPEPQEPVTPTAIACMPTANLLIKTVEGVTVAELPLAHFTSEQYTRLWSVLGDREQQQTLTELVMDFFTPTVEE